MNTISNYFKPMDASYINKMLNEINDQRANNLVKRFINIKGIVNKYDKSKVFVWVFENLEIFKDFDFIANYTDEQLLIDFKQFCETKDFAQFYGDGR
ncbi:MAG: hypothetical protein ACOC22_01075 [bacterium]